MGHGFIAEQSALFAEIDVRQRTALAWNPSTRIRQCTGFCSEISQPALRLQLTVIAAAMCHARKTLISVKSGADEDWHVVDCRVGLAPNC